MSGPFEPASLSQSDTELIDAIALLTEWREEYDVAGPEHRRRLMQNRTRLAEQVWLMNWVNRCQAESLTALLLKAEFELGNWPETPVEERNYDCVVGGRMSVMAQLIATLRQVRDDMPAAVA